MCRNLPELISEDFCSNVDLSRYQWIHFEVLLVIWSGNEPGIGWEIARNGLGMSQEWVGNEPGMGWEWAGNELEITTKANEIKPFYLKGS